MLYFPVKGSDAPGHVLSCMSGIEFVKTLQDDEVENTVIGNGQDDHDGDQHDHHLTLQIHA
jgi:hypothetical protein